MNARMYPPSFNHPAADYYERPQIRDYVRRQLGEGNLEEVLVRLLIQAATPDMIHCLWDVGFLDGPDDISLDDLVGMSTPQIVAAIEKVLAAECDFGFKGVSSYYFVPADVMRELLAEGVETTDLLGRAFAAAIPKLIEAAENEDRSDTDAAEQLVFQAIDYFDRKRPIPDALADYLARCLRRLMSPRYKRQDGRKAFHLVPKPGPQPSSLYQRWRKDRLCVLTFLILRLLGRSFENATADVAEHFGCGERTVARLWEKYEAPHTLSEKPEE